MAGLTRKELKTDRFAQEVGHTVEYVGAHRKQLLRYGAIALAIIIVLVAVTIYRQRQHAIRQQDLASALRIQEAAVGQPTSPGGLSFPTQQAKDEAALKAFSEIAQRHSGSDEADIATYYQGLIHADAGKLQEAERLLKQAAEGGDREYASLAKLSLAQLYFTLSRRQDAEKLLRDLMENPTTLVSKEQATITLARGLSTTNPAEAKKLLEPLRTSRSAVSQAAISLYADLTATP